MQQLVIAEWAQFLIVLSVGLLCGSFTTLASYRLARGEPGIVTGRSRCPACHHTLGVFDLFPLFSWLWLRGRCRYCQVKVSWRYPMIELVQAGMFYAVYLRYGLTLEALFLMLLSVALLILIVVDLQCMIIPNAVNLAILCIGLAYALAGQTLPLSLAGAAIGLASGLSLRWIFTAWKKIEALGMGDVKFLVGAGLFLGVDLFISFFFLAGVIGIVTALLWKFADRGRHFPFGPALAVALFFCVLFPEVQGMLREQVTEILIKHMMPVGEVNE